MQDYVEPGADGQVQRVAERFALIAFAGELAAEAGILPYAQGEATTAAQICFQAWVAQRGGQGAQERTQALQQVRHFLELHQASRFQNLDHQLDEESEPLDKTINLAGYRKSIDDVHYFLFQPEVFRLDVCKGLDTSFVCKALAEAGFLTHDVGKLTRQIRLKGTRQRLYAVKADILEGDA